MKLYSKPFKILFAGIGIIALFLMSPVLYSIAGALVIGGVLQAGILGKISNKVGGIVAFDWKGINAVRSYVVPSNPNTAAQQIQRARMTRIIFIARQIAGLLLQPYWDQFYSQMSGFNAFIKYNIMQLAASTYLLTVNNVFARGNLLGLASYTATYTTGTGAVDVAWTDNTNGSTGLGTDNLAIIVMLTDGTYLGSQFAGATRADTSDQVSVATGLTAANVIVYCFFYRGTGSSLLTSNSSADLGS